MGQATRDYCNRLVSNYLDEIEKQKGKISKNFGDMDLKNASIQKDMKNVVDEMTSLCDSLKRTLDSYSFE